MIHNGIEYADMQLIAEAYDLMRYAEGLSPAELADVFREWNEGELGSYLIEITVDVLEQVDAATGKPFLDIVVDEAGQQGCTPRRSSRTRRASTPSPRAARSTRSRAEPGSQMRS
jgi:6-phosphogluconate dehydrogenase